MSKITYNKIYSFLILCMAAALTLSLPACKKDLNDLPVITEVRNYVPSPSDTVEQTIKDGQWVVVIGRNLGGVKQVLFGGIPATINTAFLTNESIVVQVPSIPFSTVERSKLNEVTVVSEGGMATFIINVTGVPIISRVRDYLSAPNDTVVNSVIPGQKINLVGFNYKSATKITFQGVDADLTKIVYTDSSAIVEVPADLSASVATQANIISYTTKYGTGTFAIRIIGPPIITYVSKENPNEGDSVVIIGNNFLSIESLTFAGTTIASFKASADGNSLVFKAPAPTQAGPVKIKTIVGEFTTAYNVNDIATGRISDFEWNGKFSWDWWAGANLECGNPNSSWPAYNADVPGNSSQFLVLKHNLLNPGAGTETSTAVRISNVDWLPAANIADPTGSWALKFEMYVPQPWKGGTLCVKSSNNDYMFRFEPWQISANLTAAYSTKGWITVSIPLSAFRKNDDKLGDGKGDPIANLGVLLGTSGKSNLILYTHNYGSKPTETGFYAAFDNFRVVRR